MEIKAGAPAQGIEPGEIQTGDDGRRYIVLANRTWFDLNKVAWINRSRQVAEFQQDIRAAAKGKS